MKIATLKSPITQAIRVQTHNNYDTFILTQSTVPAERRPSVENSIVMTADQLAQLLEQIKLQDPRG